ncbi:CheR family methyltransferase [Halomonas sp. PAMB 3232]|uniref:CheR family methyltransferase n=1 Tax=Halomonas sp. PAMB 3232 TaxID=3075221 RepID=UPI0028973B7F|nr:CheR family methyltransferase [Halomonas sp. PAMB 3232]WNL38564.1 CheR family methyltransferase [Halomonas sp. PAMB 3232]
MPLKQLVYEHYGLQLDGLAEPRLLKAINALINSTGKTDTVALIGLLENDKRLFDDFIGQLTINETYFYREVEALDWLVSHYLPLRLNETSAPLRLLSAGCSSGEEPYSLAMALMERFGPRATSLFSLTGGDVDKQMLARAQRGLYSGMAFRTLPPHLKARYFKAYGRQYLIDDALRDWVHFQTLNVLAPTPESDRHAPFDVILFRNVSIYFDEEKRRVIQQRLSERLAPTGVLLCGVTETLGNDLGILELTQDQGVFHFRHANAAAGPVSPVADARLAPDSRPVPQAPKPLQRRSVEKATNGEPPHSPPASFKQRLELAREWLDHNQFDDAEACVATLLKEQPWSVDALVLAGLIARWQKNADHAQALFKRAIYVMPECWPAHFYQAELFRTGELPRSPAPLRRGYEATLRLLDANPTSPGGLEVMAPPIPPGDAFFLAKRYLEAHAIGLEDDDGL